MHEISLAQLAGIRFQQALAIFRDVWRPIVDNRMHAYFGADYLAHLDALHQSDRVFIDFDTQHTPQFDLNAIIYLLLEDGGLRQRPHRHNARVATNPTHPPASPHPPRYVPQLFGFKSDVRQLAANSTVLVLPNPQYLHDIRRIRNEWAHQHEVPVPQLCNAVTNLLHYVNVLDDSPPRTHAIRELRIHAAQLNFYALQSQRDEEMAQIAQLAVRAQHDTIQQLQTQVASMHTEALPHMDARLAVLQRDQNLLLTGIMESLTDVQQLSDTRLYQLRDELFQLRTLLNSYPDLHQQLYDATQMVTAQQATIHDMQHQIDGLRTVISTQAVKTSPIHHAPADITAKVPVMQHLNASSEPILVVYPHTRWRVALFVVLSVGCGIVLWMHATLALWLQYLIP